ncbi:hypothetical protein M2347_003342 [Chryseobacterium sp. H1D6B]|uniref:GEVED domain-containing protein n=1 Tax=Chryseobacterium sp. H1D6B TaxID=2940588 RepID=UPI0015CADF82|nr:GEVED domain-containing protein [Chryseobacterium sp. H1D6B]MDH6253615.1 hypothetical protein [Chryseobacterium sp. H1D6B]
MKKISLLAAFALCSLTNAQYCSPVFQYNADGSMITNVTFGSINNTSPFQSGTTPSYENFTSLSTDLQKGGSYPVFVKGPSSTFPSDVMVFIDFNQNGNFNDAGESFYIGRLGAASPANAETVTASITVPNNAVSGNTRMRILKNTNTAAYSNPGAPNSINTACDNLRSGQAEDYSVNITAGGSNGGVFPSPYCGDENITTSTISEINKVEFAGVIQDSPNNGTTIEDFTGIIFNVNKESSYPISITGGTHGQTTVSAYVYIDFNHNNIFDPEEAFKIGYLDNSNPVGTESGIVSGSVTIPSNALLGQTRFRVVKAYESSSWMGNLENLPCPSGWFIGQAEDYTMNVSPASLSTAEVKKENFRIYPNPTTGAVHIKTSEKFDKYEVYSLSGQKLLEGNSETVNMNGLIPGTYLIKIQTKTQKIITEKVIKK